jgi:hypothetical protein
MFIKLDLVIRMDFTFYSRFKPSSGFTNLGKSLTDFIKEMLHGPDPDQT